jgi:uncharacterized protein (DUF58 family)
MKLTREGKRFLLATVLLTFAAFNTGNNLIYLILALMLSIIAISAAALIINMRGLSLDVSVKGPVYAGQAADLEISAENKKRLLPSYSLRVILPEGMRGEGRVAQVAALSTAKSECRVSFEKRGVYKWGDFVIESSFPFIFLTRKVRVPVEGAVTVYPELMDVEGIQQTHSGEGQSSYTIRPGRGEDLLTIRDFRAGDDVKLISWKASAKARGLMVRELAEEQPRTVNIILDDLRPFDSQAFERVVSYAASLAVRLIDEDFYVGLTTAAKTLPFGSGPEQLYRILDVLAVIRETELPLKIFESDTSSTSVLVLKSQASLMKGLEADMVVYASEL